MVPLVAKAKTNASPYLTILHTLTLRTPFIFSPSVTVVIVYNAVASKTLEAAWKWSSLKIKS